MRTLVTGANGFVGRWLARRLVSDGHRVRALVRDPSRAADLDPRVECVQGDLSRPESLADAVEGQEVVFHLAGIRRAPRREPFFAVNADGTRAVRDAMLRAGARRLVHCGSLAAVGPSLPDRPHREVDPFAPEEWYGESKAASERIAFEASGRMEVTVVRPPRILGPGDRENLVFFRLVRRGLLLEVGGGPRPLSVVDVEDVVDLLVVLATHPAAVGEAFFAPGPETTTLEKVQAEAARLLGVQPRTVRLSPTVLRTLAAGADGVSRLTGRSLPLNRKLARQLLAPAWTCSGEKARARLGWVARHGVHDSIARSAAWYQQHGWL